ncbi:MAG: hypothetical protein JW871_07890, partial [Endomicrobiales bacterium]|nr:hypothetical protein [Endomicrobiales bacterium]
MNIRKLTILITLSCFVYTFVIDQPLKAVVENNRENAHFSRVFDKFLIPASVGRITKSFDTRYSMLDAQSSVNEYPESRIKNQVIVNIQDLHCHPEVQRNISKIIAILDAKFGLEHVYVEGASGPIDTTWLTKLGDRELRTKILDSLVDSGKLTGAEYYSVSTGKTGLLIGADNRKLHTNNIIRLNYIEKEQKNIHEIIESLSGSLEALKDRYYCPGNKKLDKIIGRYKKEKLEPRKYYSILNKYAIKQGIYPVKSSEGFMDWARNLYSGPGISEMPYEVERFRNLIEFSKSFEVNKGLDYKKVGKEIQSFISLLKNKLPYNAYNMLLSRTNNLTQTDLLYSYLSEIVKEYKLDISASHPNLEKFFEYINLSRNINPIQLIREEQDLINEIRLRLADRQSEREVIFLIEFTRYLKDYLEYKVSAEDYEYIRKNLPKFSLLWSRYVGNDRLASITPFINLLNEYYCVNLDRNECLLSNCKGLAYSVERIADREKIKNQDSTLSAIRYPLKTSTSQNTNEISDILSNIENIVVLVTGGFHTPGITQLMEERGQPYIVITPNITQGTEFSESVYSQLLKEQSEVLSQYKVAEPDTVRKKWRVEKWGLSLLKNFSQEEGTVPIFDIAKHIKHKVSVPNALALKLFVNSVAMDMTARGQRNRFLEIALKDILTAAAETNQDPNAVLNNVLDWLAQEYKKHNMLLEVSREDTLITKAEEEFDRGFKLTLSIKLENGETFQAESAVITCDSAGCPVEEEEGPSEQPAGRQQPISGRGTKEAGGGFAAISVHMKLFLRALGLTLDNWAAGLAAAVTGKEEVDVNASDLKERFISRDEAIGLDEDNFEVVPIRDGSKFYRRFGNKITGAPAYFAQEQDPENAG